MEKYTKVITEQKVVIGLERLKKEKIMDGKF
jgi:hypothetical protein